MRQKYPYQLAQNDVVIVKDERYVVLGVQMKGMLCKIHVVDSKPLLINRNQLVAMEK